MAAAAGTVTYQSAPAPLSGLTPPDAPASFCRYGNVWLGWLAPDVRLLDLPALPRGRYRARFWDAGSDTPLGEKLVWSEGQGARLELPPGPAAVYLQVEPAPAPAPAARPAPKSRKTVKKPVRKTRRRRR
jgi:hypothetical protein